MQRRAPRCRRGPLGALLGGVLVACLCLACGGTEPRPEGAGEDDPPTSSAATSPASGLGGALLSRGASVVSKGAGAISKGAGAVASKGKALGAGSSASSQPTSSLPPLEPPPLRALVGHQLVVKLDGQATQPGQEHPILGQLWRAAPSDGQPTLALTAAEALGEIQSVQIVAERLRANPEPGQLPTDPDQRWTLPARSGDAGAHRRLTGWRSRDSDGPQAALPEGRYLLTVTVRARRGDRTRWEQQRVLLSVRR